IRELEIEHQDVERYIPRVDQLGCLRVLVVYILDNYDRSEVSDDPYTSAVRLVQAHQKYHGMKLLQHCRFTHRKHDKHDTSHPRADRWNVDISNLFPLMSPSDLKLALPQRPMDSYLSRLTTVTVDCFRSKWNMISSNYSGMSVGQILQRCRSLIHLRVAISQRGGIFQRFLGGQPKTHASEWQAGFWYQRPFGGLIVDLPLGTGMNVSRLLTDGLHGFASSLQSLTVYVYAPRGELESPRIPIFEGELFQDDALLLGRLQSLTFSSDVAGYFDYRFLQLCPNLAYLHVAANDSTTMCISTMN
ncbi:hypothetical protein BGZ73_009189, partial [Actinomortierella ambigua]